MTISHTDALNNAKPETICDLFRAIELGSLLRAQLPQVLRRKTPATPIYNLATLQTIQLPATARAANIVRATSLVGTVTGELTPVAYGTTPTTGQVAVGPNGNIVVLATDAITSLDVIYTPERGDVMDIASYPVASNVLTLPTSVTSKGVVLLLEVQALTGTSAGNKVILVPGAGAPAAGQARLNVAKTTITFAVADAVTSARVKLLVCAEKDLNTLLEADSSIL
jgi:hypothetical protein